jgi:hypothetical protein
MFEKGYFEHNSPTGESASTVADDVGYEYIAIGENIALGNFENDAVLVKAWMDSPGHRANILSGKFTQIGIAVGRGEFEGRETWMGVQIFGKPSSACPAVNTALRARIEADEVFLDSLNIQIKAVERELREAEGHKFERSGEYNELVAQYNALAVQINETISLLKARIADYNYQVRLFNNCVSAD